MAEISRVTRSRQVAKSTYDRLSRFYDLLAGGSEKSCRELGLKLLDVQPGESVLEIGFGTGTSLVPLARSVGPRGKVHGLDISPGMLAVARARLQKADLPDWVEWICGDAAALAYPAELDAVFMCFSLELFDAPEIPLILLKCRRSLRPAGRICVVAMSKKGKPNLMTRLYGWAHRKFPNYVDCRPIQVRETLEAAGFDPIETRRMVMWGMPVEIVLAGVKAEERISLP